MDSVQETIALSDPGEVGKAEHTQTDRVIVGISNIVAWIFPILMVAICAQVVLRSLGHNQAWLDDLQWWLYGSASLVGIAYAVTTNSHVRVDILYDGYSDKKKTRIDILGLVWLFLPFVILCWDVTVHYAIVSAQALEGSDAPNGLHGLYLLKILMNLIFVLIGVAAWSAYVRRLRNLTVPVLWKQLLYALPSTTYLVNLAVFYGLWWFHRLTQPGDVTDRDISRLPIFDEVEFGAYDIEYTILITLVATPIVILIARLLAGRSKAEA